MSEPSSTLSVIKAVGEGEGRGGRGGGDGGGDKKSAITSVLDPCLPRVNNYI